MKTNASPVGNQLNPLPCNEPCPKCGGSDINRTFHPAGKTWSFNTRQYPSIDLPRVYLDGWSGTAKLDTIEHHCRTCQYAWFGAPLDTVVKVDHPGVTWLDILDDSTQELLRHNPDSLFLIQTDITLRIDLARYVDLYGLRLTTACENVIKVAAINPITNDVYCSKTRSK